MPVEVLLAVSQRLFRDSLRAALDCRDEICVLADHDDGEAALATILAQRPDAAVLELCLSGLSGLEVARRAKAHCSTRCLLLCDSLSQPVARLALNAGVAGLLLMSSPLKSLVDALGAAHRAAFFAPPEVAAVLVEAIAASAADEDAHGEDIGALTPRELEVLKLVAEGWTTKEIAQELGISVRTADAHRAHIMRKLSLNKATDLVRIAIRAGLVKA